jgi:Fur family transcriptional regulator, iron response regulator
LSAEQVIGAIRATGLRISKATVYNTLNLFCERGLLRAVDVDPTRQYYDSSTGPHHHFYNIDTGELTDIPLESVALNVETALPPGTEQSGVEVVVRVRGVREV